MSRKINRFSGFANAVEQLEPRALLAASYTDRGWIAIIVDHTIAASIAPKLERWKQTLIADGFKIAPDQPSVLAHTNAPRMNDEQYIWANTATPPVPVTIANALPGKLAQYKSDLQDVKNIVNADVQAALNAGSHLTQIVLVGHVTVPYSGAPRTDMDAFNQHEPSAATSDSYYADFDGTPRSWGDFMNLVTSGHTDEEECTTNEGDQELESKQDGRFDTMDVPRDAPQFTITGTGAFRFNYSDVNSTDEQDTHVLQSDTIAAGTSEDQVREVLDDMLGQLGNSSFATVVKDGNSYAVRLLDSTGDTEVYEKTLTASVVSGSLSISSTLLQTGGLECSIGRIDMANLDSAFPLVNGQNQSLTNAQIELELLNRYFDKDNAWRLGQVHAEKALIDQTTEDLPTHNADSLAANYANHVGSSNVLRNQGTWLSKFGAQSPSNYLFAGLIHPGWFDGISSDRGSNPAAISSYHFNFTPLPAQAVFLASASSWSRDWNNRSYRARPNETQDYLDGNGNPIFATNTSHPFKSPLQRAVLAANGISLVSTWWRGDVLEASFGMFNGLQKLALGYTAGEGLYEYQNSVLAQRTFDALMGDPTTRAAYPNPVDTGTAQNPTPVTETINLVNGQATLSWKPSPEASLSSFLGYKLYRASSLDGTFEAVGTGYQGTLNSGTVSYTDTSPNGKYIYMVRVIKTETTNNGSYENASTGVFATKLILQGSTSIFNGDLMQLKHITSGDHVIGIWRSTSPISGSANYLIDDRVTTSIEVQGNAGPDKLQLDYSNGSPVPGAGINFIGGTGGGDAVVIIGARSSDTIAYSSSGISSNSIAITYDSGTEGLWYNGSDSTGANVSISGGLQVQFTKLTLSNTLSSEPNDALIHQFNSLSIAGSSASATLNDHGNQVVIVNNTFSIASGGKLDLHDNDMIVKSPTSYAAVVGLIASARNGGTWDGAGIRSNNAATASPHSTTIGAMTGTQYLAQFNGTTDAFHGVTVSSNYVLLKYLYYGDADWNGVVNFDDYSRIDNGFNTGGTTWYQGDFDHTGVINFDDYALIDYGYVNQGGSLFTSGPGGGNPLLIEIAQMPHFTQEFMWYFIDWNADNYGIYYTPEDFFPDGVPW